MNIRYVLLAYLSLFSLGLIDNSRGPVYPQILEEFNLTTQMGSLIFSIASLLGILTSVSSKFWYSKWGPVLSSKIFLIIQVISSVGIGLSGFMQTGGFLFLVIFSALFGISLGGLGISSNILISKGSTLDKRRKYYAGLHAMYGVSSLLAPVMIALFLYMGLSWKIFFIFLAIFPLIAFLINYSVKYDGKQSLTNRAVKYKNNQLFVMAVIVFFAFYVASEIQISSRLVFYLKQVHGFDQLKTSIYLGFFFLFLLIGRVIFSLVTVRAKSIRLLFASIIGSFIFSLAGLFIHPFGLCLCGLSMSFFFPVGMDWINSHFKENADNIIYKVMTGVGIGLVVMHFIFGQVALYFSTVRAMELVVVYLILTFFLLVLINQLKKKY